MDFNKSIFTIATLVLLCMGANAQSVNNSMQTSAKVNSTCTISASDVNFGNVEHGVATNILFNIDVHCNNKTNYILEDKSNYGYKLLVGSEPTNKDTLQYLILRQEPSERGLGSVTQNLEISGVGKGSTTNHKMKAYLAPSAKRVRADTYSSSYTVTLTY